MRVPLRPPSRSGSGSRATSPAYLLPRPPPTLPAAPEIVRQVTNPVAGLLQRGRPSAHPHFARSARVRVRRNDQAARAAEG